MVKGNVKKPTEEANDADKAKSRDLELVAMTLMVEGIKGAHNPLVEQTQRSELMQM